MSTLWVLAVKMEVHFEPKRHPSSDKRARKEASIALLGAANREGGEVEVPSSKGGKTIRKLSSLSFTAAVVVKTIFVDGMTLSTEFNKSHICSSSRKKWCVVVK